MSRARTMWSILTSSSSPMRRGRIQTFPKWRTLLRDPVLAASDRQPLSVLKKPRFFDHFLPGLLFSTLFPVYSSKENNSKTKIQTVCNKNKENLTAKPGPILRTFPKLVLVWKLQPTRTNKHSPDIQSRVIRITRYSLIQSQLISLRKVPIVS